MRNKIILALLALIIIIIVANRILHGNEIDKRNAERDSLTRAELNTPKIDSTLLLLQEIKKEKVVKDAIITDANVLYVSVETDGTSRDGLAEYFCKTFKSKNIEKVKIVQYGSQNSPKKDNAYGILLGESNCK